jgi:hypothetical protein
MRTGAEGYQTTPSQPKKHEVAAPREVTHIQELSCSSWARPVHSGPLAMRHGLCSASRRGTNYTV